ncbi:MAG: hypothetical protein JF615_17305, partial [Asticcacaulis sp.]|nr:hypothetical protein [Asticcacaulis sp.]
MIITRRTALLTAAAFAAASTATAQTPAQPLKVAVLLDDYATLIDFAGFW